jgi:hypothetical protein
MKIYLRESNFSITKETFRDVFNGRSYTTEVKKNEFK